MSFRNTEPDDSDLFEEFEFKPLSAGLGFHKKDKEAAAPLSVSAAPSGASSSASSLSIDIKAPLPRKKNAPAKQQAAPTATVAADGVIDLDDKSPMIDTLKDVLTERTYKRLKAERPWEIDELTQAAQPETWKKTSFDLTALLMDTFIVGAFFLLALMVFVAVTEIDLVHAINRGNVDENILMALGALGVATAWIYMVSCRLFAGMTAGEFIFDQRLGLDSDFEKASYGWKVALRTTILFATGLVVFPLIEEITRKDLLGSLLNLHHYRKVHLGSRPSA